MCPYEGDQRYRHQEKQRQKENNIPAGNNGNEAAIGIHANLATPIKALNNDGNSIKCRSLLGSNVDLSNLNETYNNAEEAEELKNEEQKEHQNANEKEISPKINDIVSNNNNHNNDHNININHNQSHNNIHAQQNGFLHKKECTGNIDCNCNCSSCLLNNEDGIDKNSDIVDDTDKINNEEEAKKKEMAEEEKSGFEHVKYLGFGTTAIRAGLHPERWNMRQITPPISLSITYQQQKPGKYVAYDYSRDGNPTRDLLEENIAALEEARYCRVFSSGMGATAAIANLVPHTGHVILADDGYYGAQRYFGHISRDQHGIGLDYVDFSMLAELKAALKPNTKLVWLESPSNPLLKVVDIRAIANIIRVHNQCHGGGCLLAVDSTLISPVFFRPLALGADLVMHSVTKYINGHDDVLMGAVLTNHKVLDDNFHFQQGTVGNVPSSFDCYLVLRGIKTLHLRMRQHQRNALAVARWLEADSRVEKVFYPELESHPQHKLHKLQTTGMSGLMSFCLRGGLEETEKFLTNLKVFLVAATLGGCGSIASWQFQLPHMSTESRHRMGIGEEFKIEEKIIRLSIGCEEHEDLIQDLDQAMTAAFGRCHWD